VAPRNTSRSSSYLQLGRIKAAHLGDHMGLLGALDLKMFIAVPDVERPVVAGDAASVSLAQAGASLVPLH
jgi:hypothetical protein